MEGRFVVQRSESILSTSRRSGIGWTGMGRTIKPYKAKSLAGAERRVRELVKGWQRTRELLDDYARANENLKGDRRMLAMLAAEGPALDNPLLILEAKGLRDRILRDECGLNPDGTLIKDAK